MSKIGYDFNGVVDTGNFVPTIEDVIITGNTIVMVPAVLHYMKEHQLACAIYFNPYPRGANNIPLVAFWKAEMINKLNLEKFYEDQFDQWQIIKDLCPGCEIIKV